MSGINGPIYVVTRRRFDRGLLLADRTTARSHPSFSVQISPLLVCESAVIMFQWLYLISTGSVLIQALSYLTSIISLNHLPVLFFPLRLFHPRITAHKMQITPVMRAADVQQQRQSHPLSQPLLILNDCHQEPTVGNVYTESRLHSFTFFGHIWLQSNQSARH